MADTEIVFNDPEATQKGPLPLDLLKQVQAAATEPLRIDSRAKDVYIFNVLLDPPLTVKEFQLLELLYSHTGEVLSKDEIAKSVWDYEVYDFNAIDALVYRLRQRIEKDPRRATLHCHCTRLWLQTDPTGVMKNSKFKMKNAWSFCILNSSF